MCLHNTFPPLVHKISSKPLPDVYIIIEVRILPAYLAYFLTNVELCQEGGHLQPVHDIKDTWLA